MSAEIKPTIRYKESHILDDQALSHLKGWGELFEKTGGALTLQRKGQMIEIRLVRNNKEILDLSIARIWIHCAFQITRTYCHERKCHEVGLSFKSDITVEDSNCRIREFHFIFTAHRVDAEPAYCEIIVKGLKVKDIHRFTRNKNFNPVRCE